MKIGDYVKTPRFLNVKVAAIYERKNVARLEGYTEPTHYESGEWDIFGKHTGENRMIFAAVRKC